MNNKTRVRKTEIPAWFTLEAYDDLRNLNTPLDWLKQFAFRIDLQKFWKEIADYHFVQSTDRSGFYVFDIAFEQIFETLKLNPVFSVDELTKQYSHLIDFATVRLVDDDYNPIRPLTLAEMFKMYCLLDSERRRFIRHVLDVIEEKAPFPASRIYHARSHDAEGYKYDATQPLASYEDEVLDEYLGECNEVLSWMKKRDGLVNVLNFALSNADVDSNPDFMEEPILDHIPKDFVSLFAVDANVPTKKALYHFKKCYETCQGKRSDKDFSKEQFDLWRGYGVIPYIDLQFALNIEAATHQVSKASVTYEQIAQVIYPKGRMREDPDRVSLTTKPEADRLMNPKSVRFRQLRMAALRGPTASSASRQQRRII